VLKEASQQGWGMAVSNPCFEVWLQLHLREAEGVEPREAKAAWRALRNDRGPGWFFTRDQVRAACSRGAAGNDWIPEAPGSHVHRLVDELVS